MVNVKKVFSKTGINRAIAYTIFGRSIQALGGVGSVVFIARYLSKDEQGYYYTFSSILAIQIFFELGLSSVLTQYVAHEVVNLKWKDPYNLEGEEKFQSRLASLLHFCFKWFARISVLLFLILNIAGYVFFSEYNFKESIHWQIPWLILSFTTSGFLMIDPFMSILEGLGKVQEVARMRLFQQTVYIVCLIIFLFSGFKLYSSALATFFALITVIIILFRSGNIKILYNLWHLKSQWIVSYRNEIFPYQWKIAVSWISGYFIFQLFNPVLFATEGPIIAGQMGMTIAALNGILGLSMSWINTNVPLYSSYIAQRNYLELDKAFFKGFIRSIAVTCLGLFTLLCIVFCLRYMNYPLGKRFLPSLPLSFMCCSFLINCIAFGLATYLRCHKFEPLLAQSVVFAICTSLSTVILGKYFGVFGVTAGYLALGLTVGLPWVIMIFITKRKEWHQVS